MVSPALVSLLGAFLASLALLALTLRLVPRWRLLAEPNARSSHQTATPTGGGVAIVTPALFCLGLAVVQGEDRALGLLLGGGMLALIGLLDDLRELDAALRFGCQVVAVVLLLWFLALDAHWLALAVIAFLLLWHVNLFNFMDGIDGIAGVQTMIFCLGAQLIAGGVPGPSGLLIWVLAGATLGFLTFNWPPARIFMGDVGSLFLGLALGALVIELHRDGQVPFFASIILLTGFWFDASYTLCVRMVTGQSFTQAHRSHLYQRVTDRLGHLRTTLIFVAVALVWLLPLAWLAARHPGWGAGLAGLASVPYLIGAVALGAGRAAT